MVLQWFEKSKFLIFHFMVFEVLTFVSIFFGLESNIRLNFRITLNKREGLGSPESTRFRLIIEIREHSLMIIECSLL